MLKARDLIIGRGRPLIKVGLNFELCAGHIYALMGENAVGKTTLLDTLTGLIPVLGGEIEIEQGKKLKKSVARVFTGPPENLAMTVCEYVALANDHSFFSFFSTDHLRLDKLFQTMGLENIRERRIDTLSDGQLQRVKLAQAIGQERPIIVLDEPLSHLDIKAQIEIVEILKELVVERNRTIIFSGHEWHLISKFIDEVLFLDGEKGITQRCPSLISVEEALSLLDIDKKYQAFI